jgi:hypothetical protein
VRAFEHAAKYSELRDRRLARMIVSEYADLMRRSRHRR